MDTRTGEIATIDEFRQRGMSDSEMQKFLEPVQHEPKNNCPRCNGSGRVHRTFGKHGFRTRKFKPCRCTKEAK